MKDVGKNKEKNLENTVGKNLGKKNLLIATDNFLPRWDGIARFLSEIIPRLVDKYAITVVAPDLGTYEDPSITLIRMPINKWIKVGDFAVPRVQRSKMRKAIRECDLVFSQTIGPIGMAAIRLAKKHKKPVAAYIHSIEWELVPKAISNTLLKKYAQLATKKIARRMYNRCNLLIMPSASVSDLFVWNNIRTPSEIVHLGVDTRKFAPAENLNVRTDLRKQLGIHEEDIIIGYHGRIGREKDLITLLRAFTRVQMLRSNVKLLIVGDGLESVKKQLLSRKDVLLTGSKNNPVPYLQIMDVYCLTSLTETTCLGTLEAMSCGLPVISTEVGFIKSYIKNTVNGLFFEKQNPYHLARQIELLIREEKLRKKLGENARKTIVERFSWDKTAEGILNALEKLEKTLIIKE